MGIIRTGYLRTAGAAALLLGLTGVAGAGTLGPAANFNAVIFGDITAFGGDTEGRLAVGGNAELHWYSVGGHLPNSYGAEDRLIVEGNLWADTNWQVYGGNAVYGGTLTGGLTTTSGTVRQETGVFDFAAVKSDSIALSNHLGTLTSNGASNYQWGGLTLTGADAALNVFTVDASQWQNAHTFYINAPSTSTVILNIAGESLTRSGGGIILNGVSNTQVLYNFHDATTLNLSSMAILGSVLAPEADLTMYGGNINGVAILDSASMNWGAEFHHHGFTGNLPNVPTGAIPEPASLGVLALAGVILASQRGRRQRQAA
jgi:choice-of-anchor A domain-containing protein